MVKSGLLFVLTTGLTIGSYSVASPATGELLSRNDQNEKEKPNIVLILADDLGVMDLCSYSSRIHGTQPSNCYYETPNIDALAKQGVSFKRAYTPPLCSPTRATLISGQYAAKLGFNNAFGMKFVRSYRSKKITPPTGYLVNDGIARDSSTQHHALISAVSSSALISGTPDDLGADIVSIAEYMVDHDSAFIGKWHIGGGGLPGYGPKSQGFDDIAFYDEGWSDYYNWRKNWHNPGPNQQEDYLTDEITSQAVTWISNRKSENKPFFLLVSHFAVHTPLQTRTDTLTHFEEKATRGIGAHNNPKYASMIGSLDDSVGNIIDAINDAGLRESTIVIFMSDNGGALSNREGAVTSNLPFRGGKTSMYEGGIRVPLIFKWPGQFKTNSLVDMAVDATDIYPTLLAAGGYDLKNYDKFGDGQSLVSALQGQAKNNDYDKAHYFYDPFYRKEKGQNILEFTPKTVVIEGDYKLIQYHLGYSELYNLNLDPFEENEISGSSTSVADHLRGLAASWEQTIPKRYRTQKNPAYTKNKTSKFPMFRDDYYRQVNLSN